MDEELNGLIADLKEYESCMCLNKSIDLKKKIQNKACDILINKLATGVVYEKREALEEAGFEVFCAERDSFGWLVGGIMTSKGSIIFG